MDPRQRKSIRNPSVVTMRIGNDIFGNENKRFSKAVSSDCNEFYEISKT